MIQNPCVPLNPPVQPQYNPAPQQQPNYNAVKIDIHNPSVSTAPAAPQIQPQYEQPTAPIYNYPQAPIYNYPQAPVCCPPIQYPTVQPQVETVPNVPVEQPQPVPAPAAEQVPPVVVVPAQENHNAPVVVNPEPVKVPEAKTEVPAPEVSKPEVVAPEKPEPQVDLNAFIAGLSNPEFENQLSAMEQIAKTVKQAPEAAEELVDTKVFDALNNILATDTSKLEGPTQAQNAARQKLMEGKQKLSADEEKLAYTLAPKELAERNKCDALFTIAMLDKVYVDAIQRKNNTVPPLTDLPSAVQMTNSLKDNNSPMVRASAIEALSYLQRPEYKNDLVTLFNVAKGDKDPGVAQEANAAIEKLNQI